MKLYRVNEAARELACSEAWLRRAEHNGEIPQARRDLNGWRVYNEYDIAMFRELLIPTIGTKKEIEDAIRYENTN